jgi:hypothetical protein
MSGAITPTRLRYRPASPDKPVRPPMSRPAISATDPRWVLAMRVSEAMEGAVLEPSRRDRLIRLGRVMGLNAFESNLVIAIVQDQARRGLDVHGAVDSLNMVPMSGKTPAGKARWRRVAVWVGLALAAELTIALLWLG